MKCQPVADIGERHEALDLMITVGAPPEYMQREIDLGGSELGQFARGIRHGTYSFSRMILPENRFPLFGIMLGISRRRPASWRPWRSRKARPRRAAQS